MYCPLVLWHTKSFRTFRIGNPKILKKNGININVESKNVGENLQDVQLDNLQITKCQTLINKLILYLGNLKLD